MNTALISQPIFKECQEGLRFKYVEHLEFKNYNLLVSCASAVHQYITWALLEYVVIIDYAPQYGFCCFANDWGWAYPPLFPSLLTKPKGCGISPAKYFAAVKPMVVSAGLRMRWTNINAQPSEIIEHLLY